MRTIYTLQRDKELKRKGLFLSAIAFVIMFSCTTKTSVLGFVVGDSMSPTLKNGQITQITLDTSNISRYDIVTFKKIDKILVKRVIAIPHETICVKNNALYINGTELIDVVDINMNELGILSNEYSVTLGENEYWVMGDNRNNSIDSRSFGAINYSEIIGINDHLIFSKNSLRGLFPMYPGSLSTVASAVTN